MQQRTAAHLVSRERLEEARRVDADRERADRRESAVVVDAFRVALEAQDAGARGLEVAGVVVDVQPCANNRSEQIQSPRAYNETEENLKGSRDSVPMRSEASTPRRTSSRYGSMRKTWRREASERERRPSGTSESDKTACTKKLQTQV